MRLKTKDPLSYIDLSDEVGRNSTTRSRAGKKAKTKGASFERRIAKSLGDWWDVKFYRTPQSGGSHLKEGYELAGDVATPAEDFRFHVECKNQEAWTIHGLMTSPKSSVWKWWKQTRDDCPSDRIPLLIFTRNHLPTFVMLGDDLLEMLWDNYWNEYLRGDIREDTLNWFEDRAYISVNRVDIITLDRLLAFSKDIVTETFRELGKLNDSK
jgi:hypothetical protein